MEQTLKNHTVYYPKQILTIDRFFCEGDKRATRQLLSLPDIKIRTPLDSRHAGFSMTFLSLLASVAHGQTENFFPSSSGSSNRTWVLLKECISLFFI